MVEALRAYIITVADEQGAVLVFEDMHWADPSSLELLDTIIAAAHQTRLLVICTCRLEYRATWLDYQQVSELELERLSAQESLKFVEQLLAHRQVDTAIKHEIATKTDRMPLFVEELIRTVLSSELEDIPRKGAVTVIPDSLQSSLMARLDQLHEAKALVQIGAAIGREFEHDLLADVSALASNDLHIAVAAALSDGVVERLQRRSEVRYTFHHALMRDVAYQSMLRERRRAVHSCIAQTLKTDFESYWIKNAELIAHHYTALRLDNVVQSGQF
jgi:predicted ATPase